MGNKYMFGYFNPRNSRSFLKIRSKFKKFYCTTCKSIQYNYGYISKALLSYDVALLSMLLDLDTSRAKFCYIPCPYCYCGSFKNVKNDNDWKAIAALNLLIFTEKLNDDILDEKSWVAKIILKLYSIPINRAVKDFPAMAKEISEGYLRIVKNENQNADAITIANDFSQMICKSLSSYFSISEQQKKIILAISSWIYLIDALDDYDKDVRKKRFNPFVTAGMPFKKYIYSHWENIIEIFDEIFENCLTYDDDNFDYYTAEVLLNQYIPDVTQKIFNSKSLAVVRLKETWYYCRLYPRSKE